ncbi:hypothetical protein FRB98_006188 [Tulasnella sp. 332]|nr:hypothetical protein FRB98_006188 [Tulasnella sp. 332]
MSQFRNSSSSSRTTSPDDLEDEEDEFLTPETPSSPSQLVLVQDIEDLPELELWESDEDVEQNRNSLSADGSLSRPSPNPLHHPIEPLDALQILLLLIAPSLKLGAAILQNNSLQRGSLPLSVPGAAITLTLLAFLNPLATQIYMMLGQYVGKWTIEGVVGEAFVGVHHQPHAGHAAARRHSQRNESPWKKAVVRASRATVACVGALLCAAYLRESTDLLVPLVPKSSYTFERVGVTVLLGVLVSPLLHTTSIASKRVRYSNAVTLLLYAIVVIVVVTHRYHGGNESASERSAVEERGLGPIKVHLTGGIWEWLNMCLFAFNTQLFTLPLFASFTQSTVVSAARRNQSRRAAPVTSPVSPATPSRRKRRPKMKKPPPMYQFLMLTCIASAASVVLLALPLFVGYGRESQHQPSPDGLSARLVLDRLRWSLDDHFITAIRILQAGCLLLAIPPLWVSTVRPRLYTPTITIRWVQEIKWHWVLFLSLLSLSAFSPPSLVHFVSRSAGLGVAGLGYLLPAIVHGTLHTIRKPLAIILPLTGPESTDDLLLRRKERSLQRKRWINRAGWDLAVWLILTPMGASFNNERDATHQKNHSPMATRNKTQAGGSGEQPTRLTRSASRVKVVPPSNAPRAVAQATLPSRSRSLRTLNAIQPSDEPVKTTARKVIPKGGPQPPTGRATPKGDGVADVDSQAAKTVKALKQQKVANKGKNLDREAIQAFLRIRPPPTDAPTIHNPYLSIIDDTSVDMCTPTVARPSRLHAPTEPHKSTYTFSHVFPPTVSQSQFFMDTTLPLVMDVLAGDNALMFAYGVTNSGKTFTVQGGNERGQAGILLRSLDVIFNSIEGLSCEAPLKPVGLVGVEHDPNSEDIPTSASFDISVDTDNHVLASLLDQINDADIDSTRVDVDNDYEYAIWVSYAEIYNEKIYDLLGSADVDAPAPATNGIKRSNTLTRLLTGPSGPSAVPRSTTFTSLLQQHRSSFRPSTPNIGPSFSVSSNLAMIARLSTNSNGQQTVTALNRKALPLRVDATAGAKYVHGLREVRVRSSAEARQVVKMGQINRRVFGTLMNKESSRSHAVFTVKIIKVKKGVDGEAVAPGDDKVSISRMAIVDLAGSERYKNTQNSGERLKEAGNINKSLMILGQCMEAMRTNQRRAAAASRKTSIDNVERSEKKAAVPFWYSKVTELFQDFFDGDGRVAMIVNVNPYDTGFDENSHVMKFSALAKGVTTNVAPIHAKQNVVGTLADITGTPKKKRTVTIVTSPRGQAPRETLWEVAEEEEDEDDADTDREDDLVDRLFSVIEDLKAKLFDAELRYAMAEVEVREEVTQEYEERIAEMEATFAKRRLADEEANEAKMDKKIDLLYRAGLLGGKQSAARQEEPMDAEGGGLEEESEDVEAVENSLIIEDNEPESPSPRTAVLPDETVLAQPDARPDEKDGETFDFETPAVDRMKSQEEFDDWPGSDDEGPSMSSTDTATDDDWAPTKGKGKAQAVIPDSDEEVVKVSRNAAAKPKGKKKAPPPVMLYDVSMEEPVVQLKKPKSTKGLKWVSETGLSDEDDGETEVTSVPKKRKRHIGGKIRATEEQILEVTHRVEESERTLVKSKSGNVRRMMP